MSASSPVSSLSSPPVSEAGGDSDHDHDTSSLATGPPTKKRRVTKGPGSPPHSPTIKIGTAPDALPPLSPLSDVSSDADDYLPGDQNWPDEVAVGSEQVRKCSWGNCQIGDLRDQDELVKHVHDVHVSDSKSTKYTCEWNDCKAKNKPQGSAYALRAHLRSHTKEKPFYCALPECDRNFTRSDALAKHMRTVHETENAKSLEHPTVKRLAGETSTPGLATIDTTAQIFDAKGRSSSVTKGPKSIKLHFGPSKTSDPSTPIQDDDGLEAPLSPLSPSERDEVFGAFPSSFDFTQAETAMPRRDLYRLLRRQLFWAEQEGKELLADINFAEKMHQDEWMSKELVLENVLEADYSRGLKQNLLGDSTASATIGEGGADGKKPDNMSKARTGLQKLVQSSSRLPMAGSKQPWYRTRPLNGSTANGVASKGDAMDLDATEDEAA